MNKEYYIASACDKIIWRRREVVHQPAGCRRMFFRGSLDKLGIYPDIYQIGKYKARATPSLAKTCLDAHREFMNSLLG